MASNPAIYDFINGIHESFIGFGGGIIILVMFWGGNRNYLSLRAMVLWGILLYGASIGTGMAYSGQRDGAFVAGVVAPIIYCTFATILIRYNHYKSNKKDKSNYDHLIE